MKRFILALVLGAISVCANAALVPILNGQAYYDDVLDMTWLTDANYAKTSGFDSFGLLSWADANAFIDSLNSSNYLGFNDWRLPNMDVNDDNVIYPDFGEPVTDSELSYMNIVYGVNRSSPQAQEPFTNLQPTGYWSSTLTLAGRGWYQDFEVQHLQGEGMRTTLLTGRLGVWVTRSGNSAIPIPAASWLFGSALGLLGWMRRRTNQRS